MITYICTPTGNIKRQTDEMQSIHFLGNQNKVILYHVVIFSYKN